MSSNFELDIFLKENSRCDSDPVHLVFSGMVVSGQVAYFNDDAVLVISPTICNGESVVESETVMMPIDRILSWGKGEIKSVQDMAALGISPLHTQ